MAGMSKAEIYQGSLDADCPGCPRMPRLVVEIREILPICRAGQAMTNIIIEPTTVRGDRGTRYRVYYEGAVLIEETWNPELDACRLLAARRITGRLEVWRTGKPHADLIVFDIEKAAKRTVKENGKRGPIFALDKRTPVAKSEDE
jgi:hypothetical protein